MNQLTKVEVTLYAYFGSSVRELNALKNRVKAGGPSSEKKILLISEYLRLPNDFIAYFDEIIRLDLMLKSIDLEGVLDEVNVIYQGLDELCQVMSGQSIEDLSKVLFVQRYAAECKIHNKVIKIAKVIKACNRVVCKPDIGRVFLLSSHSQALEEKLFLGFIQCRFERIQIIRANNILRSIQHIKRLFRLRDWLVNSGAFSISILRTAIVILRETYKIYQAKFFYTLSRNKLTINPKPNTIILVHSHRPDILTESHFPVMEELSKLGYHPVSVIVGSNSASLKELSKSDYDGVYLDIKATVFSLVSHLMATLRTLSKWGAKQTSISPGKAGLLLYQGVSVFELVKPELNDLFGGMLFRRLNYLYGLKLILKRCNPVAVKAGAECSELNVLIHNMLRGTSIFTFQFHHSQSFKPLFVEHYQSQMFAVEGENVKKLYLEAGIAENRLVVTGIPRYDRIKHFRDKYTRKLSKQMLNVDEGSKSKIVIVYFHDIDATARINTSEDEGDIFARISADFNVLLFIKPHPGRDIRDIKKRFSGTDFRLVEKVSLNWHLINASDLVIIDGLSTIVMEAMMLSQPRIIVLTDASGAVFEQRFHGGALQVENHSDLYSAIDRLVNDEELCIKLQSAQKIAVAMDRGEIDGKSAKRVAEAIHEKLGCI